MGSSGGGRRREKGIGHQFAETLEAMVHEETNVARGESGDAADFLITEALLEF